MKSAAFSLGVVQPSIADIAPGVYFLELFGRCRPSLSYDDYTR